MIASKRIYLLIAALTLLALCAPQLLLACPTCKDSLANDPAAASMARAYQYSILFMMSMPFLILFTLGAYFYWEIRRARKAAQRSGGSPFASPAPAASSHSEDSDEVRELVETAT